MDIKIERRNDEFYSDPTPYEAIKNIERDGEPVGQTVRRGDIYYIKNDDPAVMRAGRPAIIVSNNKGNMFSSCVEVVYLTRQEKKPMPTHVEVWATGTAPSVALCERIETVHKDRLEKFVLSCTDAEMAAVNKALAVSIGLDITPQPQPEERVVYVEKPVENKANDEELLRARIERDMYERLYNDMLARMMAEGRR